MVGVLSCQLVHLRMSFHCETTREGIVIAKSRIRLSMSMAWHVRQLLSTQTPPSAIHSTF